MSRHPDPGFDQRIADWLEADPDHAPAEVMRTVASAIPSIPQRRALRLPWRNQPVNRLVILFASVALLAALGLGAWTVGARPTGPAVTPVPSGPAAVGPSPTATLSAALAYVAARDSVCRPAVLEAEPLKARFGPIYDSNATDDERERAIAALREFADLYGGVAADLAGLEPPPELVAEHAANVAHLEDVVAIIRASLALHDEGRTAEAVAVDLAADGISGRFEAFEERHALTACP